MSQLKRKVAYRTGLFDPVNLTSTEGICQALEEFAGVINKSNSSNVLDDIIDQSHIVELILSGLSDDIPLQSWILEQFPSAPLKSFETSFPCKLLSKLSNFFLFNSSADESVATLLRKYHQTVRLAPAALQALFNVAHARQDDIKLVASPKKLKAKSSQRETKLARKVTQTVTLDDHGELFVLIDTRVPQTCSDAATATTSVLNYLKNILQFYLTRLRDPEIFNFIQESFIPKQPPIHMQVVTESTVYTHESPSEAPETASDSSAFPLVQPMKSALYFSTPEGFGAWRVLVASQAHRDLRRHYRGDQDTFGIIVKKIKELSRGHFSADNQKRLNGPATEVPVFEAKMTGNLRLVYQIDCVSGYDDNEIQVVRLFGIYTHEHMDKNRLWANVASKLSKRGSEYRKRCLHRNIPPDGGNVYLPASFPPLSAEEECLSQQIPDMVVEDDNQLHKILTLEKYITLSQELLDSIEADCDVAFPFEVSRYERTIIQHPSSCYVLGRSGTGKTTTMLFKMLWIERTYYMSSDNTVKPRQVFVTQSRVLAGKVEELFGTYFSSLATSSDIAADLRLARTKEVKDDNFLRNEDDNTEWRNDLPCRFSQLEDKHFPLFITVDRLYAMIEADLNEAENVDSSSSLLQMQSASASRPSPPNRRIGKLVTFERFLGEYWPHFHQSVQKTFSPSLVFSQIMGVILGSQGALMSVDGCLDRQNYEKASNRTQSALTDVLRSALYDIFLSYRKMKGQLGDFDAADRTHYIFCTLINKPLTGQKFDYLYVDETQDNLLIDAMVLRMLCRNPDGLFWAGDTAQTISAGSSFRFNDLKSSMFEFERQKGLTNSISLPLFKFHNPREPKVFHLGVNYRSHAGIVNCAHAVIELIQKYWPYSIDILPPERGNTDGAKPIFYKDIYHGFMQEGHFLTRDRNSKEKIELGANQCILVRDDAAKKRLEDEMGKVGLILTIYDSKGLEFNDVFLYNFFRDSTVNVSQWRVVLNEISGGTRLQAAPAFDPTRHAAICSELKSLYVAITRARNNLRIADESLKGEPMRDLWGSRIRNCSPGEEMTDFAVSSTEDEWAKRAKELFDSQKYALARDSYEKARQSQDAAVAHAFYLRQVARRIPTHKQTDKANSRNIAFTSAANSFSSCAYNTSDPKAKTYYYILSADCFEAGGNLLLAAQRYQMAEVYTKAVQLFRKLGKFNETHNLIVNHSDQIEPDVLKTIRDVVCLYFVSKKEFEKAHQLFETIDEEIEYLEDRNLDLAHLDLLLLHGRKTEAADIHIAEGRILDAMDLLTEGNSIDKDSILKAKDCAFRGLWQQFSLGSLQLTPEEVPGIILELQDRLTSLDQAFLNQNDLQEMEMFRAITSGQFHKLSHLAGFFLDTGNKNAAVLCFDYHFTTQIPSFRNLDIVGLSHVLKQFFDYILILHDLAFFVDPGVESRVWTLFGYKPHEQDNHFIIPPGTLLHRHMLHTKAPDDSSSAAVVLSRDELVTSFRECIQYRLLDRVTRENDVCRQAPALFLCLRHISYNDCSSSTCTRTHISPDCSWFRHWLDVHLFQILIYHSISSIQFRAEMQSQRRFWIGKLHEVLNPPLYSLGSSYDLREAAMDVDLRKASSVIIDWVRTLSSNLKYQPSSFFLTVVMQTTDLAFRFDRKQASKYLYRLPFILSPDVPPPFVRETRHNTLHELLVSFNGHGPSSLLMGILFIRHVMEATISVDVNVFFSFIERICATLIIFNQYQWSQSFHTVVLPRSWLTNVLSQIDPTAVSIQDTNRYWLLLEPLGMLLKALYFSHRCDHILFGPDMRSIASQGNIVRSVYISRICRTLGLLAWNIRSNKFQEEIHSVMTSLRLGANHGFSRLYARYVYSENIADILWATRRSMINSPLDELVQLFHSKRLQFPVRQIFGLRRIVYTNQEDILPSMNGRPSGIIHISEKGPKNFESLEEGPRPEDKDEVVYEKADEVAEEYQNFIPEAELPKDFYVGHSEGEVAAALLLQRYSRRILQERKRLFDSRGLEGITQRWFTLCTKNLHSNMNHGFPSYKLRYLCFIPPLLGSLEVIQGQLLDKKAEFKKRLISGVGHEQLDEVGPGLTHINFVIKAIKRHQQVLGPQSDLHLRQNVGELRKLIQNALELLCDLQLPVKLSDQIKQKLQIIHLGMVQETLLPEPTKRDKKPELNMDECTPGLKEGWEDESEIDEESNELEPNEVK